MKRDLVNSPYIEEDEYGNIHIDTTKIIEAWKNGATKADRKKEKKEERDKRKPKPKVDEA